MAVTIQPLIEPQAIPNVSSLLFTAIGNTSIDALTLYNPLANAACKVTLNWVASGNSVANPNIVIEHIMQPGESYPVYGLIGQVMAAGDKLYAIAATTLLVNIFASGTVST